MTNNAAFQFWITFVTSMIFHQSAGMGFLQHRHRALLTYNLQTDYCFKLTPQSGHEIKEAADSACEQSFKSLDAIEGNSCNGWRYPECRQLQLPHFDYFECSCKFPSCNEVEITSDSVSSFHDCAWKICAEELFEGEAPAPTVNFQYAQQKVFVEALQNSRFQKLARTTPDAGTSRPPKKSRKGGAFSGTRTHSAEGTSFNAEFPNVVGPSFIAGPAFSTGTSYTAGPLYTAEPSSVGGSSVTPVFVPSLNQGPHICFFCGREYMTKQTLQDHEKSHLLKLRCDQCNSTFSNQGNYNHHMKTIHKKLGQTESGPSANTQETPQPFICDVCGKSYQWARSLDAHKITHEEDIRCTDCNVGFSKKANYKKHLKNRHPEIAAAEEAKENARKAVEKAFVCEKCGARYSAKKRLQEHMALHKGETYCELCRRIFPRKSALHMHMRKEHSTEP